MPAFQNGFSRKVKISADHDDFLTFHTREKSRLAYTDVRLLAVLAWRVISCVCEMARTKSKISTLLGGSYPACVMEQHIPILGICFKQIQAARVMEQGWHMLTWYDARDEACCPLRLPRHTAKHSIPSVEMTVLAGLVENIDLPAGGAADRAHLSPLANEVTLGYFVGVPPIRARVQEFAVRKYRIANKARPHVRG